MIQLEPTNQMPGGACNTPGATPELEVPVCPKHTPSSWDPDPYGSIEFELWDAYCKSMDQFHAEWVRDDPTRKSGYVYGFAMMGVTSFHRDGSIVIKIGRSRNPEYRIKQVSKANVIMPYSIDPWYKIWTPDTVRAERLLHVMFQQYRVDGEWFALPQPIWESLHGLWYIAPYHDHDSLEFRCLYTGNWFKPHDFFEYQIAQFQRRQDRKNGGQ